MFMSENFNQPEAKHMAKIVFTKFKKASPKGVATLAILSEPSTEYNEEGEFLLKVRINKRDLPFYEEAYEVGKAGWSQLDEAAKKKVLTPAKNRPWAEEIDPETDQPTGDLVVKFGKAASTKAGKKLGVWMLDKKGNPIEGDDKAIWGGSTVQVAFTLKSWYSTLKDVRGFGVSFVLDGVVVHDAVYGGAGDPTEYEGFDFDDAEEEGEEAEVDQSEFL